MESKWKFQGNSIQSFESDKWEGPITDRWNKNKMISEAIIKWSSNERNKKEKCNEEFYVIIIIAIPQTLSYHPNWIQPQLINLGDVVLLFGELPGLFNSYYEMCVDSHGRGGKGVCWICLCSVCSHWVIGDKKYSKVQLGELCFCAVYVWRKSGVYVWMSSILL